MGKACPTNNSHLTATLTSEDEDEEEEEESWAVRSSLSTSVGELSQDSTGSNDRILQDLKGLNMKCECDGPGFSIIQS